MAKIQVQQFLNSSRTMLSSEQKLKYNKKKEKNRKQKQKIQNKAQERSSIETCFYVVLIIQ
jgi:hypothetical protein